MNKQYLQYHTYNNNPNKRIQPMQQPNSQIQLVPPKNSTQIQSTCEVWPNDHSQRDHLSIPLSFMFKPLEQESYAVEEGRDAMEQLDKVEASFSGTNAVNAYRCQSCKAFINCYCRIRSKFEYDCSICGCTNKLSTPIASLSPQLTSPVFTCKTTNPTNRTTQLDNTRTFVFLIDYSGYGEQTQNIVHYAITVIREWIGDLIKRNAEEVEQNRHMRMADKVRIMIVGVDDRVHLYRLCQQEVDCLINNAQKQDQKGEEQQDVQIQRVILTYKDQDNPQRQKPSSAYSNYFLTPTKNKHYQLIDQILHKMTQQINQNAHQGSSSDGLLYALQRILQFTHGCAGKIYALTGYRNGNNNCFVDNISEEPEEFQTNFNVNKRQSLSNGMQQMLDKTQMSISIFIYNDTFINIMPLYVITKLTNGQLKHYSPKHIHQFYYQFHYSICSQSFELATQTVLKVRHSCGIKLLAIFGQYRTYKGMSDQIQLLSCPPSRMYMFQFNVEGKLQQEYSNIQFSILYTDKYGNRMFKILTHCQKISSKRVQVVDSINYGVINQCYLWAVLHNMDLNSKVKNLQLSLQQRSKKHIKFLQSLKNEVQLQKQKQRDIKKTRTYLMFTYYLMRHFIMNTKYQNDLIYDKSVQTRSRINTGNISSIHAIWPVVYSINGGEKGTQIVQMRYQQIKNTKMAVLIDQGDFCYVHILPSKLRKQISKQKLNNPNKLLTQIIDQRPELKQLSDLLRQIQLEKLCGYMEINLLDNLQSVCVLDEKGLLSYDRFISNIVS